MTMSSSAVNPILCLVVAINSEPLNTSADMESNGEEGFAEGPVQIPITGELDSDCDLLTVYFGGSHSYRMKAETRVTSKGTTTIPEELRKRVGIGPGTILIWEFRD